MIPHWMHPWRGSCASGGRGSKTWGWQLAASSAGTVGLGKSHHDNVGSALFGGSQRTSLGKPVTVGIVRDPVDNGLLLLSRDALIGVADALEDVVDILGHPEDAGSWLGH